jgi:hypothetical protein
MRSAKTYCIGKNFQLPFRKRNNVMIFTGSIVVDHENTSGFCQQGQDCLVAIYTGDIDTSQGHRQVQNVAYSVSHPIQSLAAWAGFEDVLTQQADRLDPLVESLHLNPKALNPGYPNASVVPSCPTWNLFTAKMPSTMNSAMRTSWVMRKAARTAARPAFSTPVLFFEKLGHQYEQVQIKADGNIYRVDPAPSAR